MGVLGTTKFKSRSFEAWHKAGAKHLFPVDPNEASYEERPYMQRKDGDWEGDDLKKLGNDLHRCFRFILQDNETVSLEIV